MDYNVISREFKAPNGAVRRFFYRQNTNDYNTIVGAFVEDEYGLMELGLKEKNVVVDIGAHIGAVTMLAATIRPDLKIFAYEPVKDNFELLRLNVQENPTDCEVNIFNQAVWFYDEDKIKMYYGDNSKVGKTHKFIGSQFLLGGFRNKRAFKLVDSISLNKVFEENRIFHCHFMKVDCEGAEYGIFKGAPEDVLGVIDRIHGEWHNIEPDRIKKPRAMLLKQTKGLFEDETNQPVKGLCGPFRFRRKE